MTSVRSHLTSAKSHQKVSSLFSQISKSLTLDDEEVLKSVRSHVSGRRRTASYGSSPLRSTHRLPPPPPRRLPPLPLPLPLPLPSTTATATALSPPPTFCDGSTLVAVERLLFRPLPLLDVEAESRRQSTEQRYLIRASSVGDRGREGGREWCRCSSDY